MDTLLSQTKKLWQAAKGGASCTNDGPEDEDKDTEEALSKEPVLDNPPRVRVVPRREGGGSNRAARTTTAVRYHMSLMDEEEVRADQATASAQSRQSTAPAAAVNGGSEGAKSDDTKRKLEELARAQTEARNTELMKLDWRCWKQLADEGYFQKAEDDLTAAARLEHEVHGESDRYASLLHALAALYDKRSYDDVTGQSNVLSLTSAQYAEESLNIRMQIQAKDESRKPSKEEELLLADTMVLYGNSLANYALEVQGTPKVPQSKAFEDGKRYVAAGLDIRTRLGDQKTIPENTFTLGYVYFCHAQCLWGHPKQKHVYSVDENDTAESLYKSCLQFYFQAAGLYAERDGEEAEGSIRMVCNVALATSQMAEINADYFGDAEQWYGKAIAIQEKVFGPGHRRTKMLKLDLQNLKKRMEAKATSLQTGEQAQTLASPTKNEGDKEREREADELMQQFLSARRKEREEEQKGRYNAP